MSLRILLTLTILTVGGCSRRSEVASVGDSLLTALVGNGDDLVEALRELKAPFQVDKAGRLTSVYLTIPGIGDGAVERLANVDSLAVLSLSGAEITDNAGLSLAKMSSLVSLNLSQTKISSAVINSLAALTKLKSLNLSETTIDDRSITTLNQLPSLSDLNLSKTAITDQGLSRLHIDSLQYLDLSGTNVTATFVAQLQSTHNNLRLVRFDAEGKPAATPERKTPALAANDRRPSEAGNDALHPQPRRSPRPVPSNPISRRASKRPSDRATRRRAAAMQQLAVAAFVGHEKLTASDVVGRYVRGADVAHIFRKERNLEKVTEQLARLDHWSSVRPHGEQLGLALAFGKLGRQRLDLAGLAALGRLPSLDLDLTELHLTPDRLKRISEFSNLRSLRLSGTTIDDDSLRLIAQCKTLRELSLNRTEISDSGLKHLLMLEKLECLWLAETEITDAGVKILTQLPSLVEVDLRSTLMGDPGVAELASLHRLKRVNLAHTAATSAAVSGLQKRLPKCLVAH